MEKYEIIKELGHGCFGFAYKVLNKENNQIYVMKKIPKNQYRREVMEEIKNEAKLLSKVNNEHIVKYYESFSSTNSFNIVMEFCDGTDLEKYIDKHKREYKKIGKEEIYRFILDICEGLKEIHSKHIIHKDLKPDNLFLTTYGMIKIGDFGISRQLYNSNDFAKTANGPVLYMAPEEIRHNNYNTKVDIWALGCVIHELCTLKICFKDYQSIMDGRYGRIDENYNGHFLQDLIDVCLNQDYHKRPKASEIIDFVNSKQIPNEFQKHNSRSNNFKSHFSQQIHNNTSNPSHHSIRISHRTHTIPPNSNSFLFNGSNKNNFIPNDNENDFHSSSFMENKSKSFHPPPPISSHSTVHGPPNFGQKFMPSRSGFSSSHMNGESRFGPPAPIPFNVGSTPPPPNYFNTHGGPFHPGGPAHPPFNAGLTPSPFNTLGGSFHPPFSPFM